MHGHANTSARLLLVTVLALLGAGCGGGSSGSGSKGVKVEVNNLEPQVFSVTSGPPGGLLGGVNSPITLFFNADVDATTVGPASIQVVTIEDPVGAAGAPAGIVGQFTYEVFANVVTLRPIIEFAPQQVTFGLIADGLFEISFADGLSGSILRGLNGEPLNNFSTTFFFRTPEKAFDFNPGYPSARAFLVDDPGSVVLPDTIVDGTNGGAIDGQLAEETVSFFGNPVEVLQTAPPLEVPVNPARDIIFIFNDALLPTSVLSTTDGTSPTLTVLLNGAPLPAFVPFVFPAEYSMFHQQNDLTVVRWDPEIVSYPPGGVLVVSVGAGAQDIACNTKLSVTGNPNPDLEVVVVVDDGPDPSLFSLLEPFDTTIKVDPDETSALWATSFPGLLLPVFGGGTGEDGPFMIDIAGSADDPRTTVVPLAARVDFDTQTVFLPTVQEVGEGIFEPRPYNFSSFFLPSGWTLRVLTDRDGDGSADIDEYLVQSPSHPLDGLGAPLNILSSDDLRVDGTVDVTGPATPALLAPESPFDPLFPTYLGRGGDGGVPVLAAGAGGSGGDVLLVASTETVAVPLQSPLASPPFVPSDGRLVGVTGRSSEVTATTLMDPLNDLSILNTDPDVAAQLAAGEILLQPNVGIGSAAAGNSGTRNESIDENHPTFVLESVSVSAGQSTLTVMSGPGLPTLDQPSKNIGKAPIAAAGDSYLIGRLAGRSGADARPFAREGAGAAPFVVVNEGALGVITTGGGGGGGGALGPGGAGDDDGPASDPQVNQRGGSGGVALDDSPGAAGGLGVPRGVGRVITATEFDVVSQSAGRDLAGFAPGDMAGAKLIPNSAADGWLFDIVAFDGTTFTVDPVRVDAVEVDLFDGPGIDGPGLTPGIDYEFVVVPALDVGGAGGGGTGVSVTGTVNFSPSRLPSLKPGAGGGPGGGTVVLETASTLVLGTGAQVRAEGGRGGIANDLQGNFAGGGGGGGGNIVLRTGTGLLAAPGVEISVIGGEGGGAEGSGRGGDGGSGYIRFETANDNLLALEVTGITDPPVDESNMGRLLADPSGVAQSRFYQAIVANAEYDAVIVDYFADTNGDTVLEPLRWEFTDNGISGGFQGFEEPPFRFLVNGVGVTGQGFIDAEDIDDGFYLASDMVAGRPGLAFDPTRGHLLHARGRATVRVDRLDPDTFQLADSPIFLPTELVPPNEPIDLLSLTVSDLDRELYLLERLSRSVHVVDLDTGAFKRTITLPRILQGGISYHPALDRLILVDNEQDQLVVVRTVDPTAAEPFLTSFIVLEAEAVYPIRRDGDFLDVEFTGLAYDAGSEALWALDPFDTELMQIDFAPGSEGISTAGVQARAETVSNGARAVMSGLAFDGTELFLVHAVDPLDCRAIAIDPASVDLFGGDLDLPSFGTLLPTGSRSVVDGDIFFRFRIELTGGDEDGPVVFERVRIDSVSVRYENKPF